MVTLIAYLLRVLKSVKYTSVILNNKIRCDVGELI